MPSTTDHCRVAILNQMVHFGFITGDKDVAGMGEQTPRINLYLACAGVSSDWSERPVEQLMLNALGSLRARTGFEVAPAQVAICPSETQGRNHRFAADRQRRRGDCPIQFPINPDQSLAFALSGSR